MTKRFSILHYLFSIVKHPLFSGSFLMVVGTNFGNFFAYVYHLVIGRLLGPSSYGELATVISILGLFTVSFSFFSIVIVKFVSSAKNAEVERIFAWFFKKSLIITAGVGIIVALATPFISSFVNANFWVILMIAPTLVLSLMSLVFRSVLQGLLRFKETVILTNLELLGRLVLGTFFVLIGLSVFGAFSGIFVSSFFIVILSRHYLRNFRLRGAVGKFKKGRGVVSYAIPIFIASLASNSFISSDLILVKHFFSSHDAGIYASLANLGKIIFYGASPVAAVMFPMVSRRHSEGKGYRKIFILSILMTTLMIVGILFVYLFLPELSIKLLYGSKYLEGAPNLFWYGLFVSIYTMASLLLSYHLSKNATKFVIFAVIGALVQVVGIWFVHETIMEVIKVSIASALIFLFSLILYSGYEIRQKEVRTST